MPAPTSTNYSRQREDGWNYTEVVLEKVKANQGFGLAIVGGSDNPQHKTGDISIIVSDVIAGSPADGNLRVGDVLISVNGKHVDGGTMSDARNALMAAGMQARMEVKRPAPMSQRIESLQDDGNPSDSDRDRGKSRKKPREMEQESKEKSHRSRSRSRHREEGENGEKPRRSRSRNREDGENGEKKERRSRSRNREDGESGEKKERRSRSRNREDDEGGEKRERRSRSRHREDGEDGEKRERRSRSRHREDGEEKGERKSRGRSKSRSRDDLTRSKSKESLHRSRSKSKSRENLLVPKEDLITVVLERGNTGYGFSLGHHIFIKDIANGSPAANADQLSKGDIVYEINGTELKDSNVADCINIIKAATERVTLKILKPKPTQAVDQADSKPKPIKPSRPAEAAEPDIVPKSERNLRDAPKPDRETKEKSRPPKEDRRDRYPRSEEESDLDSPIDKEPPKKGSYPPDSHDDSWAAASPIKQNYSTSSSAHPSQEVENMDAKIERLKSGKKSESRLSKMPDARVISFHKTGSVGIQVAGGNSVGIFVAAVRDDSAAAREGLKPGDQIIMCNEIDFEDITREEAVLILLALPDDVSMIVQSERKRFEQIKQELGDNFFIRANFDHTDKANPNELVFRKGEIFNVRDTMYQGLIGYWQAQRVGKNAQMLERGVLPNKSRAEQLALAQKMEERQANTPGRSKLKRKGSIGGTLKKHKFVSQDRLDESSFAEGVQVPAYERVVLKVADFMRPVVILGACGDLARLKLLDQMPDRFELPTPPEFGGPNISSQEPYGQSIKLSEIRNVIAKNKHCLLDITPEGIEMLMYAQLCPIVVLIRSPSRGSAREVRQAMVADLRRSPTAIPGFEGDPFNAKQLKRSFANASKLGEFYPHIFTAKINTHIATGHNQEEFFYKLKEIIFNQQAQSAWMPEEKPDEMLDDMVFHAPNYQSMYMPGLDSDTEGESTTSSPVLARKHYEDDIESPLPSPSDEVEMKLHEPPESSKKHRGRSKDRRDRDDSNDREHRRSRHGKSKDRKKKEETRESPAEIVSDEPIVNVVKESEQQQQPGFDHDIIKLDYKQDYPKPPKRDPPRDYEADYRSLPKQDDDEYYRAPPPRQNGYDADRYELREPKRDRYEPREPKRDRYEPPHEPTRNRYEPPVESKRGYYDEYDDYREPPAVNREIKKTVEHHMRGPSRRQDEEEEDIPALRDPKYGSPQVLPDSPPSRRPPEVKPKPAINAVKVIPNEMKFNLEDQRKSLKKVSDREEDNWRQEPEEEDYYKPPPPRPPSSEDNVPTKMMTLQERMSKFQQKVTSAPPSNRPAPPVTSTDETPPPGRPAAPRNYVIDARNRNAPKREIYAQNTYKPQPQFAEVTHVSSRPKVEEPYINTRNDRPVESTPAPRYPGYDYVKPHPPSNQNQTNSLTRSGTHGYSVPPAYNNMTNSYKGSSPPDDYYPPYELPKSNTTKQDDYGRNSYGEDEPRVIATARGTFDHRGGLLESQETNVSIYIPAGALPEGKKQEVYFKVCQDSKYMPPLDSGSGETLLSPLVMCGPHGLKFRKPIELRLPHRGASNDNMAFSLKSSDSPVGHPAQWRNVKLGGRDLDSGRAYQVTDDTVSVLVDHF